MFKFTIPLFLIAFASLAKDELPTQSFRQEHKKLREKMMAVEKKTGTLINQEAKDRKKIQNEIVSFYDSEILHHAEWEEHHLYEKVDEKSVSGPFSFTTTMRYDHKVIERLIGDLRSESDPIRFSRLSDQVLGLVKAHFEKEEEVLLPILDRSMTKSEVDKMMKRGH
jgi:hemerythrin superfamily protein